jgi:ABC-2 type transport system permease protein
MTRSRITGERAIKMFKFIIRTLAFCRKELSSSARQPLKVLSLVLGPFIILAIFATGYIGKNTFATALVVPDREGISTNLADYQSFSKDTFKIVEVTTNKDAAIAKVKDGELGAVIVVPDDAIDQIYSGKSAEFPVYYRQLSPLQANYIEYSTYVYASEFDKVLLRESLAAAKPQTTQLKDYTSQMNASTDRLQAAMQSNNLPAAKAEVVQMQTITGVAKQGAASLIVPGASQGSTQETKLIAQQVSQGVVGNLNSRLDAVDQQLKAIDDGLNRNDLNSGQQQTNLAKLREANSTLATDITKVANIPPAVLVEPVLSKAQNLANTPANFVNFYAPAVVILLLQHMGVTLAALSIVRDRMLGAIEIFRVSPVNPTEILIGKFLSYMILLMIVSALLIAALNAFLGVPFTGDPLLATGVLLSSSFASIGLGFLIAGLSRTETQAVQWSMLLILASIFFTGFIVPLAQFSEFTRYFAYILPMTFGATNLQDVMLDNRWPSLFYLLMPLGLVYFLVGRFLYKRQFSIS